MSNHDALPACIGNTPLVLLKGHGADRGARIWGKLEFMNPGGSSKDRICSAILEFMESEVSLQPGDTIVEASAGNTAISLAMVCAAKGYVLKLVIPDSIPESRSRLLSAYGAQIILTSSGEGMRGALNVAKGILASSERVFMIDQFENPINPEIHRRTTAPEIISDLGGVPDAFVAGVGTGGTLTGVGEVFKGLKPNVKVVAVEPADSSVLSGGNPGPHRIPGIGAGFVPGVLNMEIIDDVIPVKYEEAAQGAQILAQQDGILAGLSSGAAFFAAIKVAQRLDSEKTVVTMLCDSGERYLCFEP